MKGGTYAEALDVGFNPEQAGFMARLGMDTKDEAVERITELKEKQLLDRLEVAKLCMVIVGCMGFLGGLFVGLMI